MPRQRKNPYLALPAAGVALALGLSACGAGDASAPAGEGLTVLVEGGGRAVLTPIAEAFEAETGTSVTFVELPYESLFDRLNTELSAGNVSFDVAALDAIWLSAFGPGMEPLDDMFTDSVQGDLFPALIEEAQVGGHFVGMPAWTNAQILYYRTDLFSDPEQQEAFSAEYGRELAPPTTWEEYMEVAEFFTQDTDGDGTTDLYGADVKGAVETEWLSLVLQAGAENMVLDADGNVIVNDADHKAALDAYIAPVEADIAPAGASQVDWATAQNSFNQGQLAMTRFWAHAYAQIPEDSPVHGNVGVTTMPAGPGGEAAVPGAWYLSVPEATANQEQAKEFVQFVFDHNELGLDTDLGLAATVSALESGDASERPNLAALIAALDAPGTTPRPATERWQEIVDAVLIPMLQEATTGGADTQALLDRAAEQIEAIVN
ncbi:sugar ABC transporter substrate-binding protein [Georgenia sp. H159]|uniref:ABC transporter substrate-binding protein n=1 Tax=Georgenia sp. H159 TaxID=3076115 RepID=UPI002D7A1050|nr:sugar ABC transporter substrate-binding protein [Georgenia sp. H159]